MEKDEIRDCAISANDNFLITGGKGKSLKVYSITNEEISYNQDLGGIFSLSRLSHRTQSHHYNNWQQCSGEYDYLRKWRYDRSSLGSSSKAIYSKTVTSSYFIDHSQHHTDIVNKVLFCPANENFILSASNDKTIRLFTLFDFRHIDLMFVPSAAWIRLKVTTIM